MYSPILFSAYHKDDLMNKFLSRKGQIKEVEQMKIPLSISNKLNIILIFIQTFFYNIFIFKSFLNLLSIKYIIIMILNPKIYYLIYFLIKEFFLPFL